MSNIRMLPVLSSALGVFFAVLILGFASQIVHIGHAEARVGRPLTPGSVAGVSRRTSRRTVRRHGYHHHYRPAVGAAVVTGIVIGSVVASLPPSCPSMYVYGGTYYHCGGVYYQPQYQGSNVTYVIVNSPY